MIIKRVQVTSGDGTVSAFHQNHRRDSSENSLVCLMLFLLTGENKKRGGVIEKPSSECQRQRGFDSSSIYIQKVTQRENPFKRTENTREGRKKRK